MLDPISIASTWWAQQSTGRDRKVRFGSTSRWSECLDENWGCCGLCSSWEESQKLLQSLALLRVMLQLGPHTHPSHRCSGVPHPLRRPSCLSGQALVLLRARDRDQSYDARVRILATETAMRCNITTIPRASAHGYQQIVRGRARGVAGTFTWKRRRLGFWFQTPLGPGAVSGHLHWEDGVGEGRFDAESKLNLPVVCKEWGRAGSSQVRRDQLPGSDEYLGSSRGCAKSLPHRESSPDREKAICFLAFHNPGGA
jgi:hypothetical protein